MKKKDLRKEKLLSLFDLALSENKESELINYLSSHSNLPGRRANLELGEAFKELICNF